VDLIYIATPHSHHFQNAMLAFEHGKHVLCEKPVTVNAQQAEILCKTAKEKGLFLMEAVWTRYFPVSIQIREAIKNGEIGEVVRVIADTSVGAGDAVEQRWRPGHRMLNLELAGGALLDCKAPHKHPKN
jgi:predicted dehydrogenase